MVLHRSAVLGRHEAARCLDHPRLARADDEPPRDAGGLPARLALHRGGT